MSDSAVARWLQDQQHKPPAAPDLQHPGDAFPLATLSNPPSSTDSDIHSDDGRSHPPVRDIVAGLIHPPTPSLSSSSMDEPPQIAQARRRSSSLAGATGPSRKDGKKQRRSRADHILEADEDRSTSDGDDSDSSEKTESTDLELDDMRSEDGLVDDEETGLTGNDRRRRRRRKRRNTRLDQRVVEDAKYTKEEEKRADQNLLHSMLVNGALIGLWYLFSISISVYNKWMFKQDKGDGKVENIFPFPLFTTCLHMVVQFSLASLVLFAIPSFRPRHDSINPHAVGSIRPEPLDPKKPLMTRWFYISRIGPCGIATGMDIGLGNTSLKFISLTFFTMCKSSALGFVLIFAFLFKLEQPSWRLVFIISIMTVGVVMMVAGEAAFDALGFILVMTSACASGFRWSLTQILLLRHPATSNPFSSIFFLAPIMFVSLFILAVPVEGFSALAGGLSTLFEARGPLLGTGILLFPGVLAFLMTSAEFTLLKRTSVVTLSICGIFKEVVTILTANLVFDDPLTPINLTGLVVTIASIAAYNFMKIKKMREEARMNAHLAGQEEYAPVMTRDPDRESGTSASRSNTRNLIRTSLSLAPGAGADRPVVDSPTRTTPPVKRPEDLE
ncbi:TPT-domain-containing protein [Amniculicola lignicola CBS 123094]|uniref:TPT-domain-containing protein n=1 Tax=Amniculicola lignicola CBS 123094 TaxID=1392246 RepID=A0A6A5X449_9PLEO|nr:TPT-domain-containing protein [Amniculicola lignicola CBS 123094]